MSKTRFAFLMVALLLLGCGRVQPHPVVVLSALPDEQPLPSETRTLPAQMPTPLTANAVPSLETAASVPALTQDPAVFGAIGTSEIQAFALESVVNAIFVKVMDGFKAEGTIQDYQVTSVTVFPGSDGLLTEVIYSVQTTDAAWLSEGGTQAVDNWIQGNCSRFDFFTTETEYQLKNRRLCG